MGLTPPPWTMLKNPSEIWWIFTIADTTQHRCWGPAELRVVEDYFERIMFKYSIDKYLCEKGTAPTNGQRGGESRAAKRDSFFSSADLRNWVPVMNTKSTECYKAAIDGKFLAFLVFFTANDSNHALSKIKIHKSLYFCYGTQWVDWKWAKVKSTTRKRAPQSTNISF